MKIEHYKGFRFVWRDTYAVQVWRGDAYLATAYGLYGAKKIAEQYLKRWVKPTNLKD